MSKSGKTPMGHGAEYNDLGTGEFDGEIDEPEPDEVVERFEGDESTEGSIDDALNNL